MSGEIRYCGDLCRFITANQARSELIAVALSNPEILGKIRNGDELTQVINALAGANSQLIPSVLRAEVLGAPGMARI